MTTSFTVSGDEHQRESGREREGGTERASESGDMVLVAYAGPESPAAALCNSVSYLPTIDIHSLFVNEHSSSSLDNVCSVPQVWSKRAALVCSVPRVWSKRAAAPPVCPVLRQGSSGCAPFTTFAPSSRR